MATESASWRPEDILRQQGEGWLRAAQKLPPNDPVRAGYLRMAREFLEWSRSMSGK